LITNIILEILTFLVAVLHNLLIWKRVMWAVEVVEVSHKWTVDNSTVGILGSRKTSTPLGSETLI
jgi:hypothetical protein